MSRRAISCNLHSPRTAQAWLLKSYSYDQVVTGDALPPDLDAGSKNASGCLHWRETSHGERIRREVESPVRP